MLESTDQGAAARRGGPQHRRSELFMHSDLSPNLSLESPTQAGSPFTDDTSGAGYYSNPLTSQMLYYGPEALDIRQEGLESAAYSFDTELS